MPQAKSYLIIGASRGLGLGFARDALSHGGRVTATARNPAKAGDLAALKADKPDRLTIEPLDVLNADAGAALTARLPDAGFDVIILNAGIFGPRDQAPAALTDAAIQEVMMTNAFAPARLADQLKGKIKPDGVIVFMTSLMGSIGDNRGGGYALYRASKAALNMLGANFHLALGQSRITTLMMHPGWVKTDMGGPEAPLDIATSVAGMLRVIAAAQGSGQLRYVDYSGKTLPW